MQSQQSSLFRRREGPADTGSAAAGPSSGIDNYNNNNHNNSNSNNFSNASAMCERENDALVAALLGDVRRAKKQFVNMGDEVRRHNTFLESLEESFQGARASLGRTMRRLDQVGVGSFCHMWVLFVFVVVFFMFIYLMMKMRR